MSLPPRRISMWPTVSNGRFGGRGSDGYNSNNRGSNSQTREFGDE